jgi:AraC-like DNA-binding protein
MTMSAREAKLRRVEYARGVRRIVDAGPARNHVHTLMGHGWSLRAIAGAAGLSPAAVHRVHQDRHNINRTTAAKILAISLDSLPEQPSQAVTEPFVPRVGTVRRIQALLFMGHSHADMTARSGIATANVQHQQGRWVTRSTHDAIAALYDDLWMTPGPSTKAQSFARRYGYAGPLAWDDIDHDPAPLVDAEREGDFQAQVDDVVVQRVLDRQPRPRKLTRDEAAEVYRRARARGESTTQIEERYGLNTERYLLHPEAEAS